MWPVSSWSDWTDKSTNDKPTSPIEELKKGIYIPIYDYVDDMILMGDDIEELRTVQQAMTVR